MKWLLISLGVATAVCLAVATYRSADTMTAGDAIKVKARPMAPQPARMSSSPRSSRLDAHGWKTVQQVLHLRTLALARHRTALYRAFAAYMGIQGLTSLRPVLPGRCSVAVVDLYDNLRDLLDAYPGEDWQPLRHLVAKQPSLRTCAPKTAASIQLVG